MQTSVNNRDSRFDSLSTDCPGLQMLREDPGLFKAAMNFTRVLDYLYEIRQGNETVLSSLPFLSEWVVSLPPLHPVSNATANETSYGIRGEVLQSEYPFFLQGVALLNDLMNGTYTTNILLNTSGLFVVSVLIDGTFVAGTPFPFYMKPGKHCY